MIGSLFPAFLEEGRLDVKGARLLSSAWRTLVAYDIRRPVPIPPGARVIAVGGSTLGGSGKTPLAIALARAMALRGEKVALVGHAYRARPGRARRVGPDDDVREVGDEALMAARALDGTLAAVVVAESRAMAVEFGASLAKTLILDGPLQIKPVPAFRSLLAVDSKTPWGSGQCPPRGDLRAAREALLASCDIAVAIGNDEPPPLGTPLRPVLHLPSRLARDVVLPRSGRGVPLATLANINIGLLLGLARPLRVVDSLSAVGIHPRCTLRFLDHALPSSRFLERASKLSREHRLDAWITTAKCVTRLPIQIANVPVIAVLQEIEIASSDLQFLGVG